MGKRSISTTKGGKFMNPTDQARKEARRKELKKNKKQRLAVRTAVLKSQNPLEIVQELEAIDDVDFDPDKISQKVQQLLPSEIGERSQKTVTGQVNDKVIEEKRRRLFGTFHRIVKMYEKEAEPKPGMAANAKAVSQYQELRRLWHRYQDRRNTLIKRYEAVRNAYNVTVDEIPLPNIGDDDIGCPPPPPPTRPLFGGLATGLPSSTLGTSSSSVCPGVPSVLPPALNVYTEFSDLDILLDEPRRKVIRFETPDDDAPPGEGPIVGRSKDVDKYMDEMEAIYRATSVAPPIAVMASAADGIRPPIGLPVQNGPVLTAAPQLIVGDSHIRQPVQPRPILQPNFVDKQHIAKNPKTFEAKPQMRNLLSNVTKFVPTNVKLRTASVATTSKSSYASAGQSHKNGTNDSGRAKPMSKDDAYTQFMAEMDQLMN